MKKCNVCGAEVENDAVFCGECGALIEIEPIKQETAISEEVGGTTVLSETEDAGGTTVLDESEVQDNKFQAVNDDFYQNTGVLSDSEQFAGTTVLDDKDAKEDETLPVNDDFYQNTSILTNPETLEDTTILSEKELENKSNSNENSFFEDTTVLDKDETENGTTVLGDGNNKLLSFETFYKSYASLKTKAIYMLAVACCMLMTFFSIIITNDLGYIIAIPTCIYIICIVFYAVLAILLIRKMKWKYALSVAIYSGIIFCVKFFSYFAFSQIFFICALVTSAICIFATIYLKKIDDAYSDYQKNGNAPFQLI